ncbi:MAG: hypothetical protein ABIH77_05345 [Pseudomonadota bacterium]
MVKSFLKNQYAVKVLAVFVLSLGLVFSTLSFARGYSFHSHARSYRMRYRAPSYHIHSRTYSRYRLRSGTHWVRTYTKRDGTIVHGHLSGNPGSGIHCHHNVCQ